MHEQMAHSTRAIVTVVALGVLVVAGAISVACTAPWNRSPSTTATMACFENRDCGYTQVCDTTTGKCAACTADTDCLTGMCIAPGSNPQDRYCSTACSADSDCPSPAVCSETLGACVACTSNSHCTATAQPYCDTQTLRCMQCTHDNHCTGADEVCEEGACVRTCSYSAGKESENESACPAGHVCNERNTCAPVAVQCNRTTHCTGVGPFLQCGASSNRCEPMFPGAVAYVVSSGYTTLMLNTATGVLTAFDAANKTVSPDASMDNLVPALFLVLPSTLFPHQATALEHHSTAVHSPGVQLLVQGQGHDTVYMLGSNGLTPVDDATQLPLQLHLQLNVNFASTEDAPLASYAAATVTALPVGILLAGGTWLQNDATWSTTAFTDWSFKEAV